MTSKLTKAELLARIDRDGRIALSKRVIRPLTVEEKKIVHDAVNSVWGDRD